MSSYIDSCLSVTSFEVLANGMIATAGFFITADTENSGTAILSGDFGTLTFGSIDADGAIQAGDVGGAVPNITVSNNFASLSLHSVHYAGTSSLALGYASASASASALADNASSVNYNGIYEDQTAVGAFYSLGDLSSFSR
jgi:hypothetical protein|tara:strand:+ start:250 stop:672 length:423 start_codon:yes stop_codon:yes gene_type:complete